MTKTLGFRPFRSLKQMVCGYVACKQQEYGEKQGPIRIQSTNCLMFLNKKPHTPKKKHRLKTKKNIYCIYQKKQAFEFHLSTGFLHGRQVPCDTLEVARLATPWAQEASARERELVLGTVSEVQEKQKCWGGEEEKKCV